MYKIKPHTLRKAKELDVQVKDSKTGKKKIDVFKDGKKVGSVGHLDYKDYPTYLQEEEEGIHNVGFANERRALYRKRHRCDKSKKGTNQYYACSLLW